MQMTARSKHILCMVLSIIALTSQFMPGYLELYVTFLGGEKRFSYVQKTDVLWRV